MATLFFAGDLGLWNDDYAYDRRDFVTDNSMLPLGGLVPHFFYRPLYYLIVPTLQTALAEHQWLYHLFGALAHAATCWLLWRLCRSLGLSARAGAAAALLFLCYPGAWEATLWAAALPTVLAASTALLLSLVFIAAVKRELGGWSLALLPAIAFTIPCLNEQAASVVAALPLLAWACGVRLRSMRTIAASALPAVAVGAYLYLYISTAPAARPARSRPPRRLPPKSSPQPRPSATSCSCATALRRERS